MKRIILFISICMILFACDSKKNQIELLEDNDLIYMPVSQLDRQPVFNNNDIIASEIEQIFKENWKGYSNLKEPILLSYTYYAGEDGTIQKVKRAKSGGRFGLNLPENYTLEIEPKLLEKLEEVKFEPARKDGKDVKFQSLLIFAVLKNKEQKMASKIYFGLAQDTEPILKNMYLNAGSDFMISVDEQPSPIGGIASIQKNIRYPEDAKKKKKEGTVFIKAFIDEKGDVVKTEIIKGTNSSLDTAATNAVMMTKFIPGKQSGIPVKVQVAVPIVFKLH